MTSERHLLTLATIPAARALCLCRRAATASLPSPARGRRSALGGGQPAPRRSAWSTLFGKVWYESYNRRRLGLAVLRCQRRFRAEAEPDAADLRHAQGDVLRHALRRPPGAVRRHLHQPVRQPAPAPGDQADGRGHGGGPFGGHRLSRRPVAGAAAGKESLRPFSSAWPLLPTAFVLAHSRSGRGCGGSRPFEAGGARLRIHRPGAGDHSGGGCGHGFSGRRVETLLFDGNFAPVAVRRRRAPATTSATLSLLPLPSALPSFRSSSPSPRTPSPMSRRA